MSSSPSVKIVHSQQVTGSPLEDLNLTKRIKLETPLVKTLSINGESFDMGSDYHFPLDEALIPAVVANIIANKKSDTYLSLGDLNSTRKGQDSSSWANKFLTAICAEYKNVIYVPGNHDLRGRLNPWDSFVEIPNLILPRADKPELLDTGKNKMLIGNIFYDLDFIHPSLIGLKEDDLVKFYRATHDGQHLMGGDLSKFAAMTESLAKALTSDVDVLITHALPHPCLVRFRVAALTHDTTGLYQNLNIPIVHDIEGDLRQAEKLGKTPEQCRHEWNSRSMLMGSNVIEHPLANPKNGLLALYGHNHRSSDRTIKTEKGADVRFYSYQPYDQVKQEIKHLL